MNIMSNFFYLEMDSFGLSLAILIFLLILENVNLQLPVLQLITRELIFQHLMVLMFMLQKVVLLLLLVGALVVVILQFWNQINLIISLFLIVIYLQITLYLEMIMLRKVNSLLKLVLKMYTGLIIILIKILMEIQQIGATTGCHLHLTIKVDGEAVNPLDFF